MKPLWYVLIVWPSNVKQGLDVEGVVVRVAVYCWETKPAVSLNQTTWIMNKQFN